MKRKISVVLLVLFLCASVVPWNLTAQSVVWVKRNAGTVAWDAVPKVDAADDPVKYQVYSRGFGTAVTTAAKVGAEITATQLAVTIPADVRLFFGVQAIRYKGGVVLGDPSEISWSDNPAVCANSQPFGFDTIIQIGAPRSLRTQ